MIRIILYLSLLPFLSLLIWFFPPDPRFSISLIMIFLGCSISIFIDTYNIEIKYLFDKKRLFYLAILSLLIASPGFSSINIVQIIKHNGKYIIPKPEYTTINVSDKFKLNIIENGRCYNIDLPCE